MSVSRNMSVYSLHPGEKIVESVKKGVFKSETARHVGVDRATVKRYCKHLDERGTLGPRKAPGKKPKLDEKAAKLLAKTLLVLDPAFLMRRVAVTR